MQKLKNKYYLMRHGESLANRYNLIVSHEENALHGYGLTSMGAEQVVRAAVNTRLRKDTLIVSSDYKRAKETAEIMATILATSDPIQLQPLLRERDFGDYELHNHRSYELVWQQDLLRTSNPTNGVETVSQTLRRAQKAIETIEQTVKGRKVLLVGHGDLLQILQAHHHNIDTRFHRSLTTINNAEIRALNKLEVITQNTA